MNKTKKKNQKNKFKISKGLSVTLKVIFAVIILVGTIGVGLLAGVTVGCIITTEPISTDVLYTSEHVKKIYDKDGAVMLSLTGESATNSQHIDIESVPENLKNAFIAIEDERFFQHDGDIVIIGWNDSGFCTNWNNEAKNQKNETKQLFHGNPSFLMLL